MANEEIVLANERVTITSVLKMMGMTPSEDDGVSKEHCPFEVLWHADGGQKKALQLHNDTNTAYCFACQAFYNPVKFWALFTDVPENVAAKELLKRFSILDLDLDARWQHATTKQEFIDLDSLGAALKVYCGTLTADWDILQFDDEVATKLEKCFALLPAVTTEEESERWITVTKQVMQKVLEEISHGQAN